MNSGRELAVTEPRYRILTVSREAKRALISAPKFSRRFARQLPQPAKPGGEAARYAVTLMPLRRLDQSDNPNCLARRR